MNLYRRIVLEEDAGAGTVTPVTLQAGVKASMGASGSLDNLSPDGFNFSQASPIQIDKNGNLFCLAQDNSGSKSIMFAASNDNGATWTAYDLSQILLERGAIAYDSAHDMLHILWSGQSATDGIIYRRYTIGYTATAITGFTRDAAINLQLDATGDSYFSPEMIFVPSIGAILAVWGAHNGAGAPNKGETRSSMRVLSYTAADNTAANWKAPVSASTTTISVSPAVAYSTIAVSVSASSFNSSLLKASGVHASDVYVFVHEAGLSGAISCVRMRWNSGSSNWSTGLAAAISLGTTTRAGTNSGYSLKNQLISKVVHDSSNDKVYVGLATWKSNANGDTWCFRWIDSSDTLSAFVDVYSVGGAHSYAPTGDISYDSVGNQLIASYIKTTTQFAYIQTFVNGIQLQGETILTNIDSDIPLLCSNTRRGTPAVLVSITRNTNSAGAPPYQGYCSTMQYA